jgi:hypothetical protein
MSHARQSDSSSRNFGSAQNYFLVKQQACVHVFGVVADSRPEEHAVALLSHLFSVCLEEHRIIVLHSVWLCCGWLATAAEGLKLGLPWDWSGVLKRCSSPRIAIGS